MSNEVELLNYPSEVARFQSLWTVEATTGCHLWQALKSEGYGRFHTHRSTRATGLARFLQAHRVAYVLRYGPIPSNRGIRHTCPNPSCVNPDHWVLVRARRKK
jgi:hypothetical protein